MIGEAPHLRIVEARTYERPVRLRLPFRFGAATVREARQVFLRIEVEDERGRRAGGTSAELMVPKWFDKDPSLSQADNEQQLRRSLEIATGLARDVKPSSAFALHTAVEPEQHRAAAGEKLNPLIASFGLALVDRAVLDALCRLDARPVAEILQANRAGIDGSTAPDLAGFEMSGFLAALSPEPSLHLRHTVGYADALRTSDVSERLDDGLPETLEEEIARNDLRFFKVKLAGDADRDIERLRAVAGVLDGLPGYRATLDGNEQFEDERHVLDLWERVERDPALARLRASVLFLEQPIARVKALAAPVHALAARIPVEIDESDEGPDSFLRAKDQGYTGISSKSCKGFYRSLLNAMRAEQWNGAGGRFFMSGEDLTTQAGIAVQQDLTLAALLRLGHVERNGHHYVDGMPGAAPKEVSHFLSAHRDLYEEAGVNLRLRISKGRIALGSVLAANGLGVAPEAAEAVFENLLTREEAA